MSQVLIVGSVAYDGLKTPYGSTPRTLGGAATYSSLASSLYTQTHLVGVVGEDFRAQDLQLFRIQKDRIGRLGPGQGQDFLLEGLL